MAMAQRGTRSVTSDEYSAFEAAYDWFNAELFDRQLPACLITLQRKARSRGYFANDRFEHRAEGSTTDEIALNPDTFRGRSDKEILSTLVHEMVHCWQRHFGKVGRAGYHNKEWAEHMVLVGLMPTDTGEAGGHMTGQRVTHYIMDGGRFDRAAHALLATGFQLRWQSYACDAEAAQRKAKSKTKFTCPGCGQNAWAKPDASLMCGDCDEVMEAEP
jgi:predicted SprT family Zn-dependent metalloprotease